MLGEHLDTLMNLMVFVYFPKNIFCVLWWICLCSLVDLFGIPPDRCLFGNRSRTDMRCICLVGRFSIVFGVRVFQRPEPRGV